MSYAELEAAGLIRGTTEHREKYEEEEYSSIILERMKELVEKDEKRNK